MALDVTQFDHLDRASMLDPYRAYQVLRERCPVARSDRHGGFTALSRYEHVRAAAQLWSVFSSEAISIPGGHGQSIPIMVDPPAHTRYRSLLAAFFSPRRVGVMEEEVRQLTRELIDRFVDRGFADVGTELSQALPTIHLSRLLGVASADAGRFRDWIHTLVYETSPGTERARDATERLHAFLRGLVVTRKRRRPGDDIPSRLFSSDVEGEPLTDDEITSICMTLVYAALGPTTFLINGALLLLDEDREARRRLIERRDAMPTATEEFLRYLSPVQSIGREVKRDASLFGHDFHAGERVLLLWGSANRDDAEFAVADRLVLDRSPNRHVALGAGVHHCLGAHLGRLQFRVVIDEVLEQLPDYRVGDPTKIERQIGHTCGITRLPIEFTPSRRAV